MMATDLPIEGLLQGFSRSTEAAAAFNDVMKETGKAMTELRGKFTKGADEQKKSVDKLKDSIKKQADTLEAQSKIGGENNQALKALAERTRRASSLLESFGAETDGTEWSALNANLESINRSFVALDIGGTQSDPEYEAWFNNPTMNLSGETVGFFDRWNAENRKALEEHELNLGEKLETGLGLLSAEMMVGWSFLKDSFIGKGFKSLAKSAIISWKNRRRERKIQEAQRKYYNRMGTKDSWDNDQAFYQDMVKEERNILTTMKEMSANLKGTLLSLGDDWKEEEIKKIHQDLMGFHVDELEENVDGITNTFSDFQEGIRDQFGKGEFLTKKEKLEGDLSKVITENTKTQKTYDDLMLQIESLNRASENQHRIWEKATEDVEKAKQEYEDYRRDIASSGYMQQMDLDLVKVIESEIQELQKIVAKEGFSKQQLETKKEGKEQDLNQLEENSADSFSKQEDIEAKLWDLTETLSRVGEGSPPYLLSLLEFFRGGQFEKIIEPPKGGGDSPEIPNQIKQNIKGMGEGILAGINSFLDGLNYMVKSVFEFFQTFVDGIGNVIQKVSKVISKTFINLMQGLGQGITSLFSALGRIDPVSLGIGAAALGAITLSIMGMGLALKLAAPFVNAVFGGIAKIFTSLGKVAKLVSEAIVGLMDGITNNLTELTKIPFMSFIKLGLGFAALGAGMFVFGTMSQIAVPALFALGAASLGLSQLFKAVPADQLSLMATGFRQLSGAVRDFGLNSLFLGPAVGLLTALSAIPFANKIIDLALSKSDMKSQGAESFQTDNLIVGSIRSNASQALMAGQEQAMNSRIENQFGQQKSGGDNTITTTAINNNEQHFHNTKSARNESLEYSQKVVSIAGI